MDIDKINAQMQKYVAKNEMAGGALIVRRADEILYKNKWGVSDIEKKSPVDYDTLYRMASVSKIFTAVGVLRLIERGALALDDEVFKFIPEFKDLRVITDERFGTKEFDPEKLSLYMSLYDPEKVASEPVRRPLTIRDLLTHSSGVGMGVTGMLNTLILKLSTKDTLASRTKRLAECLLEFQPGCGTGYSAHAAYDVIGCICEVVSGLSFSAFMKKEVFEPLGMTGATFDLNKAQSQGLARLYKTDCGEHRDVTGTKEEIYVHEAIGANYGSGSAGVYASAYDMDKFAAMLVSDGETENGEFLKPETVKLLYSERAYDKALELSPGMKWGLGVIVREDPEKAGASAAQGTYGWSGAFGTHFFVEPKKRLAAVFAMNRSNIDGASSFIARRVEELVFE